MVHQISKVCLALMYMQHTHMVYGKLHIYPYLVLDQKVNDNAYSTPLLHEVFNVDQKRVFLGIDLCYNTFSHIWVPPQHYPEHDTFFMSIFFPWIFFLDFPWSMKPFWRGSFSILSLNYWAKLTSMFSVPVWTLICESNLTDPGSWTLDINWYI